MSSLFTPPSPVAARQLILVEPGAGLAAGHFAEKLALWIDGAQAAGWPARVFTWDAPRAALPVPCHVVGTGWRAAAFRALPARLRAWWAEWWVYQAAFRAARRGRFPVLGLTVSNPLPVAAAALVAGAPRAGWGQVVMYGGLEAGGPDQPVRLRKRPRALFRRLVRRGAVLLPNAPLTARVLAEELGVAVPFLPDPILLPEIALPDPVGKRLQPDSLLVSGAEDHRRTPLAHLSRAAGKIRMEELVVHVPGAAEPRDASGQPWRAPAGVGRVTFHSGYLTGEPLLRLFAAAKFSAVVYAPAFLQGSANLALSVVCGTPVLASRFAFASDLFARHGRLGELFDYGDDRQFAAAWARLSAWGPEEWGEFAAARSRLLAEVGHRAVARAALARIGALTD